MDILDCVDGSLGKLPGLAWGRASDEVSFIPAVVLTALVALTTLIVGSLGMAGILPGTTVGWVVLGLGAGGAITRFCLGALSNRRIYLVATTLVALTFATLGALGGMGILSATQLGWGILGTSLASPILKLLFASPYERYSKIALQNSCYFSGDLSSSLQYLN